MSKVLRFYKKPDLNDLEGLSVNESSFEVGKGYAVDQGIILHIPNTFRFKTYLEVAEANDGKYNLIMTQFLTRGPEWWEMEAAFDRIGFKNPEIELDMRSLADTLVDTGMAYWD